MTSTNRFVNRVARTLFAVALGLGLTHAAFAAPPVVSTVPVDPNDPLQPHDIISGKITTLKGAVDAASIGATWTWNPGDGSPTVSGLVSPSPTSFAQTDDAITPHYAIWVPHTYTGSDGDVFLATLTVTNGVGESDSAVYRVEIRDVTLTVEVNVAIDEALWFMHRNMFRFNGAAVQGAAQQNAGAIPMGRWDFQQGFGTAQGAAVGAAINAFEANGYLETGPASSPYTETVARGMRYVLANLASTTVVPQTFSRPVGSSDDPDGNGNGLGLFTQGTDPPYQTGMVLDAIVASGSPSSVAISGPANVIGRTYSEIVQDIVDWYIFAQSDSASHGGWQYAQFNNTTGAHDNSASGWAAIGLLAAEDLFGVTVPQWVKDRNEVGLELTDNEYPNSDLDGAHGYTNGPGPVWGPLGVTASAMVQMAMDDIVSTTSLTPDERWIRAENYMRRHFNDAAVGNNFKNYYYAMFNFAKAMRTAVPEEVVIIGANNTVGCGPNGGVPGCGVAVAPLDWYLDPTQGLARRIVSLQVTSGNNIGMFTHLTGNSQGNNHDEHENAWATQILTRTLFQAGPVSRARATPNPGAADSPIAFDGSDSFHQDAARSIVSYQWDFDNDGTFDSSGVLTTHSFACPTLPVPCSYPVRLRVTDDNVPTRFDDDIVVVEITIPPRPPTARAGGPYLVCMNEQFQLDGSASSDVDEGTSESGGPPFDTITAYNWELDGISPFDFDEASGVSPATSFAAPGVRDIGLRVSDNTAVAFPTAGQPNLTDSDFTSANVVDCGCIGPVSVRSKPTKNQLTWAPVPGAVSYDILRSTVSPSRNMTPVRAGHVTSYATYLDANLTNGQTYYYRVRPIGADGNPLCAASLPVAGTPQMDRRARLELVDVPNVVGDGETAAIDEIVTALLVVGTVTRANSATVLAGNVISQSPPAGTRVNEGSAVSLVVSLGPLLLSTPDVIGLPSADAQAAITAAGFAVGSVTEANSDTAAAGNVISQDPIGGLLVTGGSAIDIVISLGPQTFAVPDVVGQSQAAATTAITSAGFVVGDVTTVNDAAAAGTVLSQDPIAGTSHALGTGIDLVVSLGPVTVGVPNVVGQPQGDAEAAIVAAGLGVGAITAQHSSAVAAGNVITQSPGAGSAVLPGSLVDLVVSLGPVQVAVPNVVGATQAAAAAAIDAANLTVGDVTQQNSLTVPAGSVISQDPTAGTSVDEGSLVDIVVSLGPVQVVVPNVVSSTQTDATSAIVGAGLVLGDVTNTTHATVPAGSVISQNPTAGTTVDEGTAVNIVVSLGPASVAVPDVVGDSQATAEAAIVAAGLVVGTITPETSPTVPAGSVISQDPGAGTIVLEGSDVALVVSVGPAQLLVPDVVGVQQPAAENTITGAGFVVGTVTFVNSDTVAAGDVIDQDPDGGATADEGSAIDLVVSLGHADVAVPNVVGMAQAAAETAITGAGLSVGVVTEVFSNSVPDGDVISQSPTAGLFVSFGSAVNLTVSKGPVPPGEPTDISLSLDPIIVNAGDNIVVAALVTDTNGTPVVPAPAVTYSITFVPAEVDGTAPVFAAGVITTAADTRGVYTITALIDGTVIDDSEEFLVLRPAAEAEQKQLYSDLSSSLGTVAANAAGLAEAVEDGDLSAMQSAINQLRSARNSVDLRKLARSVVFAPEGGFPPTPAQLGAAGFPNIAANTQFDTKLNQIIAKIDQMAAYLPTINVGSAADDVATLNQMNAELSTLLTEIDALAPNVRGYVQSKGELNLLMGTIIPRHMHAVVAALDKAFKDAGLVVDAQTPEQFYDALLASMPEGADPAAYYAQHREAFFSLGGLSTAANLQMKIIQQVYVPFMKDIARQLALLVVNDLLNAYANLSSISAVSTGGSLSFHSFGIPGSILEVEGANGEIVAMNDVFLVGSDAVQAVETLVDAFNPSNVEDLDDLFDFFEGIVDAIEGAGQAYDAAHQPPDSVFPGGCFIGSDSSSCVVLEYSSGFESVHSCSGFFCIPGAVIILYHRLDEGFWASDVQQFVAD